MKKTNSIFGEIEGLFNVLASVYGVDKEKVEETLTTDATDTDITEDIAEGSDDTPMEDGEYEMWYDRITKILKEADDALPKEQFKRLAEDLVCDIDELHRSKR